MFINYAYAANITDLVGAINQVVINPIIGLLFALALVLFFFGLIKFLIARGGGEGSDGISQGKNHMLWGIVGMFIMVSVFGIMNILIKSIGADGVNPQGLEQSAR